MSENCRDVEGVVVALLRESVVSLFHLVYRSYTSGCAVPTEVGLLPDNHEKGLGYSQGMATRPTAMLPLLHCFDVRSIDCGRESGVLQDSLNY